MWYLTHKSFVDLRPHFRFLGKHAMVSGWAPVQHHNDRSAKGLPSVSLDRYGVAEALGGSWNGSSCVIVIVAVVDGGGL